jgi:CRP-like cAMP-binding protein
MVREIRWRATTIETRNWDTIIIPNGQLMKGQVIVLGRRQREPQQHRQWVYFNVDYRHSPAEVIDAVESALRDEPITNVAAAPPIHCIMMEFKDSYGAYAVRYWLTDLAPNDIVNSIIRTRIYTALKRAGISPSIPAQTIFVTEDDETRRQRKQGEEAARRLAAIRAVELFNPLTDEEKEQLAQRLRPAPFSRGESLMRQGEQSSCLFILASGNAEVRISADGSSQSRRVAMVHAGDFLGEMGLMTGAPRSASVVATSDVAAWRLDKHAFDDIVQKRPQIAESISHILAHRRSELDAAKEGLAEAAMRERARAMQGDLLTRIRRFFTLDRQ